LLKNESVGCGVIDLANKKASGVVSAVFARSSHLTAGNLIITVGTPDIPSHPLVVKTASFFKMKPGERFSMDADSILINRTQLINLSGVPVYIPEIRVDHIAGEKSIAKAVKRARQTACEAFSENKNMGLFLPFFTGDRTENEFTKAALPPVEQIKSAIIKYDWKKMEREFCKLAGLGTGLTPSGDDFLVGLLSALRFYKNSGGKGTLPSEKCFDRIAEKVGRKTTSFSSTLLRCAARCWCSWDVADWLTAVHNGDARLMKASTLRVLASGHSSGVDTLAGLVTAMEGLFRFGTK
tara:strand:+ start:562 stop:1446 length:885 start_codon:yes stop_codon:yes gene_type:complete